MFVVGYLGDWRRAAAVLFERESLRGDPAPRREAGKGVAHDVAPSIGASGRGFSRAGETRGQDPVIAHTLQRGQRGQRGDAESETFVTHALRADGFDASEDGTGRGTPLIPVVSPPLCAGGNSTGGNRFPGTSVDSAESLIPIAFNTRQAPISGSISGPIDTDGTTQAIAFSCNDHGADAEKRPDAASDGSRRQSSERGRPGRSGVYSEPAQ